MSLEARACGRNQRKVGKRKHKSVWGNQRFHGDAHFPRAGWGQSRPTISDVYGRTGCPSVISVLAATFSEVTLKAAPHTAYSMVSHLALSSSRGLFSRSRSKWQSWDAGSILTAAGHAVGVGLLSTSLTKAWK